MNISSAVRVLRRSTFFGALADDRLNVLAFSAERRPFEAGDVVLEVGQLPAECLVVIRGRVEIRPTGATMTAYSAGPGGTVGEVPLITDSPANATVTAVTQGEALVISRPLFERMVDDFPDVAVKLRRALLGRLTRLVGDLRDVEAALRSEPPGPRQAQTGQPRARGRTDDPSREPDRRS